MLCYTIYCTVLYYKYYTIIILWYCYTILYCAIVNAILYPNHSWVSAQRTPSFRKSSRYPKSHLLLFLKYGLSLSLLCLINTFSPKSHPASSHPPPVHTIIVYIMEQKPWNEIYSLRNEHRACTMSSWCLHTISATYASDGSQDSVETASFYDSPFYPLPSTLQPLWSFLSGKCLLQILVPAMPTAWNDPLPSLF